MRKYLILFLLFACTCTSKNEKEKEKWAKEPAEIKYSKEREKEVWGHVLYNTDPALFYGTPVYEAAVAISNKDSEKLNEFFKDKDKSLVDFQEKGGLQPLNVFAIEHEDFNSLKVLTELGADPNIQSKRGVSAMLLAANVTQRYDDNHYLKYLTGNGGDVNAKTKALKQYDKTPLIAAARYKLENVKLLVEAGTDPHYVYYGDKGYKDSALHTALQNSKIDIVNYLIFEQGVDYNTIYEPPFKKGMEAWTIARSLRNMLFPLDSEEYKQKMKLVNYLKEQGIDYWKTKIPKVYYSNYDSAYLSKY
jgi:hypothetical protein